MEADLTSNFRNSNIFKLLFKTVCFYILQKSTIMVKIFGTLGKIPEILKPQEIYLLSSITSLRMEEFQRARCLITDNMIIHVQACMKLYHSLYRSCTDTNFFTFRTISCNDSCCLLMMQHGK